MQNSTPTSATGNETLSPTHYTGDKATYVRDMFAGIAGRYDLLNNLLSLNLHRRWRRYAVRLAKLRRGDTALDVCTGTGDFALDLYRVVGAEGTVSGSDFCAPMLKIGKDKTDAASQNRIGMTLGDAMHLPYASERFDAVTVGFGIRNVADTRQAFAEMARVAKPGGRVICLEANQATHWFWKPLVSFYQNQVVPRLGALLSKRSAYTYLPKSIEAFHSRETLCEMMREVGLTEVRFYDLNHGSVVVHIGVKPTQEQKTEKRP